MTTLYATSRIPPRILSSKKPGSWYLLTHAEGLLLLGVGIIFALTALIAWVAPPNNWDSLTYHMGRVVHWIQNGSVAPYQTNIPRQIVYPPFSEYIIAHLSLLSGTDRFANFVQWLSFAGCVAGASLIVKILGGDRRAQIVSAVVASTIPMAILQSSSTQNDLAVSFWIVCFVYFFLRVQKGWSLRDIIALSAALGLAILTKATAPVYAVSFIAWFVFSLWRDGRRGRGIFSLFTLMVIVLVLNVGYLIRTAQVTGKMVPDPAHVVMNPSNMRPGFFFSNMLRNSALHLGTPIDEINEFLEKGIYKIHKILDINVFDPRSTFRVEKRIQIEPSTHEDMAGNFLHFVLIIICGGSFFFLKPSKKTPEFIFYVSAVTAGALAFCLVFTWQPWHSRLQTPLFILYAPFVGYVLSCAAERTIALMVSAMFLITSYPSIAKNPSRRLISKKKGTIFTKSRLELYGMNDPEHFDEYRAIVEYIRDKKYTRIGFVCGEDSWEYPLWVLLKEFLPGDFRLEHLQVTNSSAMLNDLFFSPEILVVIDQSAGDQSIQTGNRVFLRTYGSERVAVFELQ